MQTVKFHRLAAAAAMAFGTLIVAGGLTVTLTAGGGHPRSSHRQVLPAPPAASPVPSPTPEGWSAVSPATTVPEDTPVQQQYDQAFEQGFASAANRAELSRLEAIRLPQPAIGGGWPALSVSNTPDGWAREFVAGLLNIDFATRDRSALGPWLAAQEAPDLMPGVPPGQYAGLYATLLEPDVTGEPSPIPTAAHWGADAAAGVRWSVSGLQVTLDPQWQSMVDAGWQPEDLRGTVEDVSGLLTVTQAATSTTHRFSLGLQLGSAHWHDGYGSVLLAGWDEA